MNLIIFHDSIQKQCFIIIFIYKINSFSRSLQTPVTTTLSLINCVLCHNFNLMLFINNFKIAVFLSWTKLSLFIFQQRAIIRDLSEVDRC